jgi:predicted nucleic acid-binding protein
MISDSPADCQAITNDPEDDYVLATARLAEASYLVTGDHVLLGMRDYSGAKIVSPREFVTTIESQSSVVTGNKGDKVVLAVHGPLASA